MARRKGKGLCCFALIALLVPIVRADWWDDFTNNLATDLAPLVALFGERATKQFLSESITIWDNLLFALCPLGILTGIVSAIRVCGGPSLRAFIGRAQEGGGTSEAELCSSTSRDVCELYQNGGIVRVFGRPKILEIVHCGDKVQLARDFFPEAPGWTSYPCRDAESSREYFAPNPNLSLNIGIRKHSIHLSRAVTVLGLLAQVSVLVFGGVATYRLRWEKNGQFPDPWAFPFMFVGTVCVCIGMFLCAKLVNDDTEETRFRRLSEDKHENKQTLYVVQPGGQTIGDQFFDSFLFASSDVNPLDEYITSRRRPSENRHESDQHSMHGQYDVSYALRRKESTVFFATSLTLFGFVVQFVGLRGLHSAVSLLQLAVTVGMSIIRSLLRTQRLRDGENEFRNNTDEVVGHELDWLALRLGCVSNSHGWHIVSVWPRQSLPPRDSIEKVYQYRLQLAKLTERPTSPFISKAWDSSLVIGREEAQKLKKCIEASLVTLARCDNAFARQNNAFAGKLPPWIVSIREGDDIKRIEVPINESGESLRWIIDSDHLEAILGLWSWSITSNPQTEVGKYGSITSCATTIPMYRIIYIGTRSQVERAETDIYHWVEEYGSSQALSFGSWKCQWGESDKGESPADVWVTNGQQWFKTKSDRISSSSLLSDSKRNTFRRLFGWGSGGLPDLIDDFAISASRITSTPFAIICAQDIYQSFLSAMLKDFKTIGDGMSIAPKRNGFRLDHLVITKLVENFQEAGLGLKDDAYLMIIPVFYWMSKLPLAKTLIYRAMKSVENDEEILDEAERCRIWGWDVWSTSISWHLYTLHGHQLPVHLIAFLDHGCRLALISSAHVIRTHDMASGEGSSTSGAYIKTISLVAFSANSSKIMSGLEDNTIRI